MTTRERLLLWIAQRFERMSDRALTLILLSLNTFIVLTEIVWIGAGAYYIYSDSSPGSRLYWLFIVLSFLWWFRRDSKSFAEDWVILQELRRRNA